MHRALPHRTVGTPDPPWHALGPDAVALRLGADPRLGLGPAEAARRLAADGPNALVGPHPPSRLSRLLAALAQPVTAILVAATAIAALVGDGVDAALVASILVVDAAIGLAMEERATRALDGLRALAAPTARGVRGGVPWLGPACEVVAGDVLDVAAGDIVPADARLVESCGLLVDESTLTGESGAVAKDAAARVAVAAATGDRATVVHAGTTVAAGTGRGIVFATGMATELGGIAGDVADPADRTTPLERRMARLGRILVAVCLTLVVVIAIVERARGAALAEVLSRALSLAVATVPEGLPAVVTVVLAVGVWRMAARHVLVRRLPAVETLGAVTVLCTDKTGTLTANTMTLAAIATGKGRTHAVAGGGGRWSPVAVGPDASPGAVAELDAFLACAAGAAAVAVTSAAEGRDARGDPIDRALALAAEDAGALRPDGRRREIPFDPTARLSGSVVERPDGGTTEYFKGAPEAILSRCRSEFVDGAPEPLGAGRRGEWMRRAESLAAEGMRVIALARRDHGTDRGAAEDGAVLAGLAGILDPPRPEARAAVAACLAAGVRPVVITGDHPATALAIARAVGIARDVDGAMTADAIDRLDDAALGDAVGRCVVFARTGPAQKTRIVAALRSRGEVVAMTGDGVNDAPALRAADVGVAMGRGGCDVTREAADLVLTDDALESIVAAIGEGRTIDDNVGQVLAYLLACNGGEVLVMFAAALAGIPAPLEPIQILWLNLVTDGAPAMALGLEAHDPAAMTEGPRAAGERLPAGARWDAVLPVAAAIAAVSLVAFVTILGDGAAPSALPRARSATFALMAVSQWLLAFGCRSRRRGVHVAGIGGNRWLLAAVGLSALLQAAVMALLPAGARPTAGDWWWVAGLAGVPLAVLETVKAVRRRFARPRGAPRLPGGGRRGDTPLPGPASSTTAAQREE